MTLPSASTPAIPGQMRAGRILGPHRSEVASLDVPTPGAGEVLIEVARAGICGTDLHIFDGDRREDTNEAIERLSQLSSALLRESVCKSERFSLRFGQLLRGA